MGVILKGETTDARAKRLAATLIGVKSSPAGFNVLRSLATEGLAYHNLFPYPWFHFVDWKSENKGPLPRCMPFVKTISCKSAKWLFGKPIQLSVPGNEEFEKYVRRMWALNSMETRMVAATEKAGYQGGLVLKWSYDETDSVPLRFQLLSPVDECRTFFDPHDKDRLLMLRVQYPFYDEVNRSWFWHREEWTDALQVMFKPLKDDRMGMSGVNPYNPPSLNPDEEAWDEAWRQENPFGIIPAQRIRNRESDKSFGVGDLWGLYRTIDRINLTYHLMDKSNQLDSDPIKIFIDLNADQDDLDGELDPGQSLSLKSDSVGDEKKRGEAMLLEPKGSLRPAMMEYARDLKQMVLEAAGSVELKQDEVTNKGNLTSAVLTQLYLPLIEATDEKRKTYGVDGICKFLERCAIGLSNYAVKDPIGKISADNEESHDVQLTWSPYFKLTAEEKMTETTTAQAQVTAGFITQEKAVERVAAFEGIDDVKAMQKELDEKHKRLEDADKANTDALIKAAESAGQDGNDD